MLKPSAAVCVVWPLSMNMGTSVEGTPLGDRLADARAKTSTHMRGVRTASERVWSRTCCTAAARPFGTGSMPPSGSSPTSSGCRHTSSEGTMVNSPVSTPRNTHVPRQPTASSTRANNGGSTNAAAPDPIVAKAMARPRFRKNQRGTTADIRRKPAPATREPANDAVERKELPLLLDVGHAHQRERRQHAADDGEDPCAVLQVGDPAQEEDAGGPDEHAHREAEVDRREAPVEVVSHGDRDDARRPERAVP